MIRRALASMHAIAAVAAAGCLALPTGAAPMCETTADCNAAAGEVCEEGVCWGDPPDGQYAAVLGPPHTTELHIATELPEVMIASNGWTSQLAIQPPVEMNGRVSVVCPDGVAGCQTQASISATVVVTRRSRITGGPRYVDSVVSMAGLLDGPSFDLAVPAPQPGDEAYVLTVVPQESGDEGFDVAAVVPPLRFVRAPAAELTSLDLVLDASLARVVNGAIVDSLGRGQPGLRITAQGRWDSSSPLERVSSIATTGIDGNFKLYVSEAALPVIDLVVEPRRGEPGPTLRVRDRDASNGLDLGSLEVPNADLPAVYTLPIYGYDSSGDATQVVGARVTMSTVIGPAAGGLLSYEVTGTSDGNGEVDLALIPGTSAERSYELRVHPPSDSIFSSLYSSLVTVGPPGVAIDPVQLTAGVAISGSVYSADGFAQGGVSLTIRPSTEFMWNLDDDAQRYLSAVQQPTAVTHEDGSFVIFVDPAVDGRPASYQLDLQPALGSLSPSWSVAVEPDPAAEQLDIFLPDAAYVRGLVVDTTGAPVEDTEVRVLQIDANPQLCATTNNPPADACAVPARVVAIGRSDEKGVVKLVLPRP